MFDVHFKLRYTRINKQPDYDLPATIQFVVNIDGIYSSPRSTGISVMGNKWSGVQQKIIGSSEEVQSQNRRLSSIKAGLDKLHQELCLVKDFVTPTKAILDKYNGFLPYPKYATLLKNLKHIIKAIGVGTDMSVKNLRKTFGSYLLNKGLRMEVIRDSMGHSTIKQTEESYTIVFVDTLIHAFKQAGLI